MEAVGVVPRIVMTVRHGSRCRRSFGEHTREFVLATASNDCRRRVRRQRITHCMSSRDRDHVALVAFRPPEHGMRQNSHTLGAPTLSSCTNHTRTELLSCTGFFSGIPPPVCAFPHRSLIPIDSRHPATIRLMIHFF